jgi:predicted nucleic acid-binding protein
VTVVVDASLLGAALVDSGKEGRWAETIVAENDAVAPELVLVETSNVLRRLERAHVISTIEATGAQRDLMRLNLELFPFSPFAERVWMLRGNLTSYDAWYVALAEALSCPLATLDKRLSRASGPTCSFITP